VPVLDRLPGFLGKVLAPTGQPVGTCFQVAAGTLVTACHVLEQIGAGDRGARVLVEPLGSPPDVGSFTAVTARVDRDNDLAVLTCAASLPSSAPGLVETDAVRPLTDVMVTGVPTIADRGYVYQYLDAPGRWFGGLGRNGRQLGQMDNNGVVRGMSGAPVMRAADRMVLGVVSGRFNTDDGWMRDRVWVSRIEDLLPLLDGIAEPVRDPHPLAAHLLNEDFDLAIIRPHLSEFVGRRDYVNAILDHLDDPTFPSGYVLLTGEPGIGKTALMAHLVSTQGWIHHFNLATSGIVSAATFLSNVCAQLIIMYGLRHAQLPTRATQDGLFLQRLLSEARDSAATGRIVVAVDAIDEAADEGTGPQTNRLSLPKTLPDGVYFVVSSRTRNRYELDSDRLRHVEIGEDSAGNVADLTAFIRAYMDRNADAMGRVMREIRATPEEFVEVLLERSEGNFLYATHVLPELARGAVSDLRTLRDLPLGLAGYYRAHWETMRRSDPVLFDELHRPVIHGFVVFLRTTASMIADTYHIPVSRVWQAIDTWREFLNEEPSDRGERRFRIYHKTFLDFLRTTAGLKEAEEVVIDTVWREIRWDEE